MHENLDEIYFAVARQRKQIDELRREVDALTAERVEVQTRDGQAHLDAAMERVRGAWATLAQALARVCEAARAWDALTRGAGVVGPFDTAAALTEIRDALGALAEAEREAREGQS